MRLPPGFSPRRVCVLRPRGLGDIVLSSGVVDALSRACPDAEIDYMAEAPARPFLESDVRLRRIFLLGSAGDPEGRIARGDTRAAIAWLRARRHDVVLDLFSNPRTAVMTALAGSPWRVGYDRGARRFVYNVRVPRFRGRPEDDVRWAGEVQLDFLRDAGLAWPGEARRGVALTSADADFADACLDSLGYPGGSRPGAVLPGGSWAAKRWSPEGFAAAGRALARRAGAPALVLWGPPEREDAHEIAARLGADGRLSPPTTLRQMAALIARLGLLVAPDCLGRHLAIVQDVPTIGVFAATNPKDWTPPEGQHRFVRLAQAPGAAGGGSEANAVVALIEAAGGPPFVDSPATRS